MSAANFSHFGLLREHVRNFPGKTFACSKKDDYCEERHEGVELSFASCLLASGMFAWHAHVQLKKVEIMLWNERKNLDLVLNFGSFDFKSEAFD